eukprot:gene4123-20305_t
MPHSRAKVSPAELLYNRAVQGMLPSLKNTTLLMDTKKNELSSQAYNKLYADKIRNFMTIGISTIERKKDGKRYSYLSRTLNSLISKMPTAAKMEVVIVILCANRDSDANQRTYKELQNTFHELIVKGFLQVIVAPERFYRSLENLPKTFNDSSLRMKWRSKQSLDYAFLLYYCHGLGEYHLQIEDDVDIEAGYYEKLKSDIVTTKVPWAIYQYYKMGFIGKLFKSQYLQLIANIFRIYYFEMPLDLLYIQPFILSNLKNRQKIASKFLFHHIGKQSSSQNSDIY